MDAATPRPNRSLASSRRTRPSRGVTLFAGGLIAAVLSMSGAGIALLTPARAASEPADIDYAPTRNVDVTRVAGPSSESDGPFYPFSVVARGVHTLRDLKDEMNRDPVVADHYGTIAVDRFRFERVAAPRLVYVSYRRGDEIYWTRNRVPLYAGENVLTDGTTSIRARCGNRISETPMEPTLDDEPSVAEFDRAIDPASLSSGRIPVKSTDGRREFEQGANHPATPFPLRGLDGQLSLNDSTLANLLFPGIATLRVQTSANEVRSASRTRQEAVEDLVLLLTTFDEVGGEIHPAETPAAVLSLVPLLISDGEGAMAQQQLPGLLSEPDPSFSPEFVPAIDASDLQPVPVPEPASLMLVGLGLGIGAMVIRRRQSRAGSARSDRTFSSVQRSGL